MSDGSQDKEVAVSAEITPTGLSAKSNSRFINAADRLLGGAIDFLATPLEARNRRTAAMADADIKIIEAATAAVAEKIGQSPETAGKLLIGYLAKAARAQENVAGVVREALEDLREGPAAPGQSENGGEDLSDEFVDRLQHYAGYASTDDLREKWARVLSSEVRQPGTFSHKVLRIVDELDAKSARTFEDFCRFRLGNVVPSILIGELSVATRTVLDTAGLLVDPGFGGHIRVPNLGRSDENESVCTPTASAIGHWDYQ